jgi:predicted CxxxxCH...CXXCH cytochrome family protein
MRARNLAVATVAICGVLACSKARPQQGSPTNRVSWEEEIAPLFASKCSSCHSGANAAAGYRTTSYLAALGPQDAPVAVAGDDQSLLLRTIDPAQADAVHHGRLTDDQFKTVKLWVVDGQLSFFRSDVHLGGILNPHDTHGEFHGEIVKNASWNLEVCAKCHGEDFAGGTAGVSCTQCHAQGPTSCDTCHGQPPATGAHTAHALGPVGRKLDCSECHVKPVHWNDPGHLTTPDGKPKTRGTVTFSAQSLAALAAPGRTGAPAWDGATCSNIYCHGGTRQDTKATHTAPSWTGGAAEAACGTCHGLPPPSHDAKYSSNAQCSACHQLIAPTPARIAPTLHVDGVVQLGDTSGTCSACHGSSAQNAGPPRDSSGNTSPTALGVGAHQAHLTSAHGMSAPVPCSACHVVPAALDSPGHVDHPLPATVAFSGLATNDGASPAWNRASATCASTYCHGGGQTMAGDANARLRTPVWTLGTSQAFCGSCHGIPPSTTAHSGVVFPDCARCHANTVAPNGAILISGPPGARTSAHINGAIDVTP